MSGRSFLKAVVPGLSVRGMSLPLAEMSQRRANNRSYRSKLMQTENDTNHWLLKENVMLGN